MMDPREEPLVASLRMLERSTPFDPETAAAGMWATLHRRRRRRLYGAAAASIATGILAMTLTGPAGPPSGSDVASENAAVAKVAPTVEQRQREIAELQEQLRLVELLERMTALEARQRQLIARMNDDMYAICRWQAAKQLSSPDLPIPR